jgi:hypothetical protein
MGWNNMQAGYPRLPLPIRKKRSASSGQYLPPPALHTWLQRHRSPRPQTPPRPSRIARPAPPRLVRSRFLGKPNHCLHFGPPATRFWAACVQMYEQLLLVLAVAHLLGHLAWRWCPAGHTSGLFPPRISLPRTALSLSPLRQPTPARRSVAAASAVTRSLLVP